MKPCKLRCRRQLDIRSREMVSAVEFKLTLDQTMLIYEKPRSIKKKIKHKGFFLRSDHNLTGDCN